MIRSLTDSINVEGLNVVESLIDHSTDEAGSMSPATGILADEINLILRHFGHEKIVVSTSNFVAVMPVRLILRNRLRLWMFFN